MIWDRDKIDPMPCSPPATHTTRHLQPHSVSKDPSRSSRGFSREAISKHSVASAQRSNHRSGVDCGCIRRVGFSAASELFHRESTTAAAAADKSAAEGKLTHQSNTQESLFGGGEEALFSDTGYQMWCCA